jgi:hypothetical protein
MTLTNVAIAPELATLFNNQIYQGLEAIDGTTGVRKN